jgi:hypothetical protein
VTTTGEETESQQHRDQINKLREKIESIYYDQDYRNFKICLN